MADTNNSIHMSLDEIIKQNRASRVRGRGGRGGRGAGRGGGPGRGGGMTRGGGINRGRGRGTGRGRGGGSRSRSRSRANTPMGRQGRSGSQGRSQSRDRSQSRTRSRSRQQRRSLSRARSMSRSRSQLRSLTPRGRAGLEQPQSNVPRLISNNRFSNRGQRNGLRRANSNPNVQGSVQSRLGVTTRRGAFYNMRKPLAVAKRGISKRGRGLVTNSYSNIGLRSDQILQQQRNSLQTQNNLIRSQTFTRSRKSFNANTTQLTVSVANDFAKRRRNSVGSTGYLNRQSLAQFDNQFGGYNTRRGPGSVKSLGSNRSGRSNSSNRSGRARGRGRGGGRGVGRNFINKQVLNPKLQREIAAIQGKAYTGSPAAPETPSGVNFSPTPTSTKTTLNQRFGTM